MINDEGKVKVDVVDELYWDNRVNAADVKVEVDNGEVTLTGTVPSYRAKAAAYSDAWLIEGVTKVNNYLIVMPPKAVEIPNDSDLETRIRNNLLWSPDIDSQRIDVLVREGKATLSGDVDMYWKKWEAENLAAEVRGIKNVENDIAIVTAKSWVDEEIAKDVESALHRNRYVDAHNITVKVEKGKVTLSGIVESYFEFLSAEDSAMYTPGVVDVQNDLIVT